MALILKIMKKRIKLKIRGIKRKDVPSKFCGFWFQSKLKKFICGTNKDKTKMKYKIFNTRKKSKEKNIKIILLKNPFFLENKFQSK